MSTLTIIALSLLGLFLVWWYGYWNYQGTKLEKVDGHITPTPGCRARKAMSGTARIGRVIFAGSVTVMGQENLEKCKDQRVIFVPNHIDEADWSVVFPELKRPTRYLAARDQISGIRKRLAAFTGAIAVNTSKDASRKSRRAVVDAACTAMEKDGQHAALSVWMQGQLVRDNVIDLKQFHSGAVRIGQAMVESGDPTIVFVPMGVAYLQDENCGRMRHFFNWLGAKIARRGVMVHNVAAVLVIGEPILVASLPADYHEALPVLVSHIKVCVDKAEQKVQEMKAAA